MIKAIIFDIDGTMVDSRDSNAGLIQKILELAGYPKPSKEEVLEHFHQPLNVLLRDLSGSNKDNEIARIVDFARDPANRDLSLLKWPEEFEETLEILHKKYRLAIVTSRIREGIDAMFSAREIKHFFAVTVGFEDYANPKPHPEPLLVAIERLGISPGEAVYVGDSHVDVEAAQAAGMKSIHLAQEKHAAPDIGITSFKEIITAVHQLDIK